jgi:dCTP deaminase
VVLSDRTISRLLGEGRIEIDPYDEALLQPSSVDVRVDRYFRVFHNARYPYIDVKEPQDELTELVEVEDDRPFILHPGEFVLGSTLELSNVANLPITIYYGMPIGQLSFVLLTEPAETPYGADKLGSKYQGQRGPTPSRYWKNFERVES